MNSKYFDLENHRDTKERDRNIQENHDIVIIKVKQIRSISNEIESRSENRSTLPSNRREDINSQQIELPLSNLNGQNNRLQERNPRLVDNSIVEQNLLTSSSVENITQHLNPVIEYAQEPLLPLIDACIPLTDIVHDILIYVQLAFHKTSKIPCDGLTYDESAAIRLYTMEWEKPHPSLYSMINSTLRNYDRQLLRPYHKYLKLLLTALVKLPCAPMQTVWRGVNKDLSHNFPRGTQVIWWSFSSCTTSLPVLENNMFLGSTGDRTLFSVEAINGRIIRNHSHFDNEDEILLLPGTYMEVQSQLCPAPDLHIIHLKQIRPTQTLLALPFQGSLLYPIEKKKVPWYQKKRTMFELSLLISLCIGGIIIGAVLGTRHSPAPPICRTRSSGIKADLFWSFDCGDEREDLKGVNNGTNQNGANYSSPDFSGQGKALSLNRKLNQHIKLPQTLNLTTNTSFTVSVWIFLTGCNAVTILSDCNTLTSACIDLSVHHIDIGAISYNWIDGNITDLVSYASMEAIQDYPCWIHLAYSFDNRTSTLSIFMNGDQIAFSNFSLNTDTVTKANQSLTSYIGTNSLHSNPMPFDGLIDQLSISYYVKDDNEIRDEATLICSYTFDSDSVNDDSGPNHIQAYSENVYRLSSNNASTLLFNSSDAYFQISKFTLLMWKKYEFTIAFWLRPIFMKYDEINSAMAILQFASKIQQLSLDTYVCVFSILIANITTDKPYFRFQYDRLYTYATFDKYLIQNNTWIHIGMTYSNSKDFSVYLNGKPVNDSSNKKVPLPFHNPRLALTIGGNYFDDMIVNKPTNYESRKCFAQNPEFNYTQMYGEIDDLKVFARALDDTEVITLANSKNKTST